MADTFGYRNKQGKTEQLPTKPSFFQKAYENAAYPEDVDRQREAAAKAQSSAGSYSPDVPNSLQGDKD